MPNLNNLNILPDLLTNSARTYPEKTALHFEKESFSYKEVLERAETVKNFLLISTEKGDVVAILLPNSPQFIFSYFGILSAGCTALLLPPNISDKSLKFQIEKTKPKFILTSPIYQQKLERAKILKTVMPIISEQISTQNVSSRKRFIKPTDIASIIFTSGTTSEPKGVKLQHQNVMQATRNIIEFVDFKTQDIDINASALSHSFGLGHIHCIFAVSGTVVLFRDSIDLKKVIKSIRKYNATTFGAVPAILRLICTHYSGEFKRNSKSLRFVQTNTSILEKELIEQIMALVPKGKFHYYYGLSEASRSTFITFNDHPDKLASVGQASPNVTIKILDKTKVLPPNQIGEICIGGMHVIKDYWNIPKKSKHIQNGLLHTGDVGYLDEDGFLYFTGRKDDIINVAGEKVNPEEIEAVIMQVPGIRDVAAIGIADKLLGEVVKIFVVTENNKPINNAILRWCRKHQESFKIPRKIEYTSEIPRTENGKLMRNKLRTQNPNG